MDREGGSLLSQLSLSQLPVLDQLPGGESPVAHRIRLAPVDSLSAAAHRPQTVFGAVITDWDVADGLEAVRYLAAVLSLKEPRPEVWVGFGML